MTIFDHLIAGRLPASFVHEDELCVAFMDINPIRRGHVLVVPRVSKPTLAELDPALSDHLWRVAQRIALAQQRGLGSKAQHFLVNDGKAASQTVPHVHLHVIPRYAGDTLRTLGRMLWHVTTLTVRRRETVARRHRFDQVAKLIRDQLG
ncbi:MAG: HIT family protein [Pseudomonadota bacterium]|nr:HIT family protein [Pseudomonadota bacterium]